MSWLMPHRPPPEDRDKLKALVAESLTERGRAIEVAKTVAAQTEADQERVSATIEAIRKRVALQQQRAMARASATTADARARLFLNDLMTDAGGKGPS